VRRINVSFDARYQAAEELIIKADLAAPKPSVAVVTGNIRRSILNAPQRAGDRVGEVTV
jgi:hypothetical protein